MKGKDANPLVSIILPIYNTAPYLNRCLDSITGQTYKELEIICVDDGSEDGSELIVDQYAQHDARIRVVHKENGGESSARNVGLRMMTGQYVGFMDCDDWIEPDMYEKLVFCIMSQGVDLVASTWYCESGESGKKVKNVRTVSKGVFGREDLLHYIYERDYYRGFAYMWDKLYRRELFYDQRGRLMLFDEDLELGGDVLYLAKLVLNVKTACYMDEAFYHYYQRDTSGCHTESLKKREDWMEAYKRVINYFNLNSVGESILPWIKRFLVYHSSNVAEMAYVQNEAEVLQRCQNVMKQYENEYCATNCQYPDRIDRFREILGRSLEENV